MKEMRETTLLLCKVKPDRLDRPVRPVRLYRQNTVDITLLGRKKDTTEKHSLLKFNVLNIAK